MEIKDEDISREIEDYKRLHEVAIMSKVPASVINRHEFMIEAFKELLLWRSMGRRLLDRLNNDPSTVSKEPVAIMQHAVKAAKGKEKYWTEVTCICGEVTKYKVPLIELGDFTCPKDRPKPFDDATIFGEVRRHDGKIL